MWVDDVGVGNVVGDLGVGNVVGDLGVDDVGDVTRTGEGTAGDRGRGVGNMN